MLHALHCIRVPPAACAGNLLVAQEPFELLARRAIGQLLTPALSCAERVHEVLLHIAEQACPGAVSRFPYLQRQLATTVLHFVRSGFEPATQMVRSLVDCEADYINTDHPDFIGGRGAMRSVMQDRAAIAARSGRKVRLRGRPPVGAMCVHARLRGRPAVGAMCVHAGFCCGVQHGMRG